MKLSLSEGGNYTFKEQNIKSYRQAVRRASRCKDDQSTLDPYQPNLQAFSIVRGSWDIARR